MLFIYPLKSGSTKTVNNSAFPLLHGCGAAGSPRLISLKDIENKFEYVDNKMEVKAIENQNFNRLLKIKDPGDWGPSLKELDLGFAAQELEDFLTENHALELLPVTRRSPNTTVAELNIKLQKE